MATISLIPEKRLFLKCMRVIGGGEDEESIKTVIEIW
jgi:hypothetical protein